MPHAENRPYEQPNLFVRFLTSVWFRMVLFVAVFLFISSLISGGVGQRVQENQTEFLASSVRRSAVQCYALEGRFPDNLSYLEENYGLIIDHNHYVVYYEPLGGNLIPQIRVIPLSH